MTRKEFAASIKAKYPQYQRLSDDELVDAMLAKYPTYKTQVHDEVKDPLVNAQSRLVTDDTPAPAKEPWKTGDDADWWGGWRKGLDDYAHELGAGLFKSGAHPETPGDFLGLLLPTSLEAGGARALAGEFADRSEQALRAAARKSDISGIVPASAELVRFPKNAIQEFRDALPSGNARAVAKFKGKTTAPAPSNTLDTAGASVRSADAPDLIDRYGLKGPSQARGGTTPAPEYRPLPDIPEEGSSAVGGTTPAPEYRPQPETATGGTTPAPDYNPLQETATGGTTPAPEYRPQPETAVGGTTPAPDYNPAPETATFTEGPAPDWAQPRQTTPTGPGPMDPRPAGTKAPSLEDELIKAMEEARQPEAPMESSMAPPQDITPGGPSRQSGTFSKQDATDPLSMKPGSYDSGNPGRGVDPAPSMSSAEPEVEDVIGHQPEAAPPSLDDLMTEYDPGAMAGRAQDLRTQYGARDAARQMFGKGGKANIGAIQTMAPGPSRTPLSALDRIEEARKKANDPLLGMLLAGLAGHSTESLWDQ